MRMYLAWLADQAATYLADPLTDRQARDWAVRDYRMWLLRDGPARRSRVYVNSALSPPRWSAAKPTWFWSLRFLVTPAWKPPAATACRPTRTRRCPQVDHG
ncbi:MAG: hypothetical protein HOV87_12600 [Catenulispora sp.]|nr:hypothetical protein [Nonomuraea sp.]NUR59490.1 hypothetical protein [Catenulispora sp.]NUT44803.1 hypothetical protein [Thermoactinospora sp.]